MFNVRQRVHYHFLEAIVLNVVTILMIAVKYPLVATITGAILIVLRIVFTIGYLIAPNKRAFGGFPLNLLTFLMSLFALWTCIWWYIKN